MVLLVDDDAQIRSVARRVLERAGWQVRLADGGEAGVAIARDTGALDVAIVDASMPGLSGADTLLELRALRPELPLVLMTGHTEESMRGAVLRVGASFLAKPFTPDELRQAVGAAKR